MIKDAENSIMHGHITYHINVLLTQERVIFISHITESFINKQDQIILDLYKTTYLHFGIAVSQYPAHQCLPKTKIEGSDSLVISNISRLVRYLIYVQIMQGIVIQNIFIILDLYGIYVQAYLDVEKAYYSAHQNHDRKE